MKTFTKALVGSAAAAAVALSSATPAMARDHRDGGIDAGDIIAGALIIGGIAAVASAAGNDRDYDYRYDRAGYRDGYRGGRGDPQAAVERCVRTAESQASRYSYGRADVTDVRGIKRTSRGYEVRGRIAVNSSGRDWRDGDRTYGRGWNGDYRGWNDSYRGYDSGSFKCKVEYGRVTDIDFSGIRGL
jgi:hypothetical protein